MKPLIAFVAVGLALIAFGVASYGGVSADALEASVSTSYEAAERGLVSSDATPLKRVDCSHPFLSRKWSCRIAVDLVLLRDPTVAYSVALGRDHCWVATATSEDIGSRLARRRVSGCVS